MFSEIEVTRIDSSPFETREQINPVNSIREFGLLQPVVVRPRGDRFECVLGHRRLSTLRALGKETVPCLIVNMDNMTAARALFAENFDREPMSDTELGKYYKLYADKFGCSLREVARRCR